MKFLKFQSFLKLFTDLKFSIFLLALIALVSSLGSVIEQEESIDFYQQNYPNNQPIYGFVTSDFLLFLGLDHIYSTWWFFSLLFSFAVSLITCTITRQFPFFLNSKDYFFKKERNSFSQLPFFVKLKNFFYLKESILVKIQQMNFYFYQKGNLIYGYKGLIGRISPILVHLSLLIILAGSSLGAVYNFKAQEILPKGELFHVQNPLKVGFFTNLPGFAIRVNDFWVEYENNRIHQFYSNLSILNQNGQELKTQTISVNNPLRYQKTDIYQSDWNLLGIRIQNITQNKVLELPLFPLEQGPKTWITWINDFQEKEEKEQTELKKNSLENSSFSPSSRFTLLFDQLQNVFFVYDETGQFVVIKSLGQFLTPNLKIIEILPSTGLLIKYDPSIFFIYSGFGLLMVTACLSYLPYTQIWIFTSLESNTSWIGSTTNRGKIQLEIEFENLIRYLENKLKTSIQIEL